MAFTAPKLMLIRHAEKPTRICLEANGLRVPRNHPIRIWNVTPCRIAELRILSCLNHNPTWIFVDLARRFERSAHRTGTAEFGDNIVPEHCQPVHALDAIVDVLRFH